MTSVQVLYASLGAAVAFAVIPSRGVVVINSDVMPERQLDDDDRRAIIGDMVGLFQRQLDREAGVA